MKNVVTDRHMVLPSIPPDAALREVAGAMLKNQGNLMLVGKEGGEPLGYIDCKSIIRELLRGDESPNVTAMDIAIPMRDENIKESTADIESIVEQICKKQMSEPLFASKGEKVAGAFSLEGLISELARSHKEEMQKRIDFEHLIDIAIEVMPFGVALVSDDIEIKEANKLAKEIMKENSVSVEEMKAIIKNNYSKVFVNEGGSYYKVSAVNLSDDAYSGILIFVDVTAEYTLVKNLKNAQEEAETALAIMLPDQRIETRLKSIVEYTDEYDKTTGMIKMTGIIKHGVYRHVISMLKLIADAFKQGLMELPGMDKNTLVQATVLHDIAKVQPDLNAGDIVNPKEVFEQGYLHAFRGASIGKGLYGTGDDVYYLIKYHHHTEKELPDDFPSYLLPMYRFFRLIDGLSAGITRRDSEVAMKIKNTRVYVKEKSNFPLYNQEIEMDLYSGFYVSREL